MSQITYGIALWGSQQQNIAKIFAKQKRCIRIIVKISRMESCRPYFKKYSLMTIPALFIYYLALLYRKKEQDWKLEERRCECVMHACDR